MHVEIGTVRVMKISGVPNLDLISVTLEDFDAGQGKISIDVWGTAWSAYWGAMGEQHTITSFFQKCSAGYLIGKLSTGLEPTRFSNEALITLTRKTIIDRRRGRHDRSIFDSLDKDEARELFDEIEWQLENVHSPSSCHFASSFLDKVFHKEWWHYLDGNAQEPNPDYLYLERVVATVKQGLALAAQVPQQGEA